MCVCFGGWVEEGTYYIKKISIPFKTVNVFYQPMLLFALYIFSLLLSLCSRVSCALISRKGAWIPSLVIGSRRSTNKIISLLFLFNSRFRGMRSACTCWTWTNANGWWTTGTCECVLPGRQFTGPGFHDDDTKCVFSPGPWSDQTAQWRIAWTSPLRHVVTTDVRTWLACHITGLWTNPISRSFCVIRRIKKKNPLYVCRKRCFLRTVFEGIERHTGAL